MADNNLKPLSYDQVRAMEQSGTGICSPNQVPWPVQQAANAKQEQQSAAEAAATDKALKARVNWKQPTSNGGKRGR